MKYLIHAAVLMLTYCSCPVSLEIAQRKCSFESDKKIVLALSSFSSHRVRLHFGPWDGGR